MWLFTWSLAATLPDVAPGHASSVYWLAGACGAVVLLASLLAHELTHAIVARRAGDQGAGREVVVVRGHRPPRCRRDQTPEPPSGSPRLVRRRAWRWPRSSPVRPPPCARSGPLTSLSPSPGGWRASTLILGLFNLLPGAPLDGGRILRAYLWRRHGDADRAAIGAARAGRVVAYALIGMGLLEFLAGSLVGGVWMAFIGWFLLTAARDEETSVLTRQSLAGVSVADAMTAQPHTAPGWISVEEFIQRYLLGDRHSAYPVENSDGVDHRTDHADPAARRRA